MNYQIPAENLAKVRDVYGKYHFVDRKKLEAGHRVCLRRYRKDGVPVDVQQERKYARHLHVANIAKIIR